MRLLVEYNTETNGPGSVMFEGRDWFNSMEEYQDYNDAVKDYVRETLRLIWGVLPEDFELSITEVPETIH